MTVLPSIYLTPLLIFSLCWLSACGDPAEDMSSTSEVSGGETAPLTDDEDTERGGFMIVDTEAGQEEEAGEEVIEEEPEHPEYAVAMLELVNNFRAEGGVCGNQSFPPSSPLSLNMLLNKAARDHAADMAANNYFAHASQDGRSPADRIAATGYRAQAIGENIAAGRASAAQTFEQWRTSPGHCANMLRGHFTELGVGYVSAPFASFPHYWVQVFGRAAGR